MGTLPGDLSPENSVIRAETIPKLGLSERVRVVLIPMTVSYQKAKNWEFSTLPLKGT